MAQLLKKSAESSSTASTLILSKLKLAPFMQSQELPFPTIPPSQLNLLHDQPATPSIPTGPHAARDDHATPIDPNEAAKRFQQGYVAAQYGGHDTKFRKQINNWYLGIGCKQLYFYYAIEMYLRDRYLYSLKNTGRYAHELHCFHTLHKALSTPLQVTDTYQDLRPRFPMKVSHTQRQWKKYRRGLPNKHEMINMSKEEYSVYGAQRVRPAYWGDVTTVHNGQLVYDGVCGMDSKLTADAQDLVQEIKENKKGESEVLNGSSEQQQTGGNATGEEDGYGSEHGQQTAQVTQQGQAMIVEGDAIDTYEGGVQVGDGGMSFKDIEARLEVLVRLSHLVMIEGVLSRDLQSYVTVLPQQVLKEHYLLSAKYVAWEVAKMIMQNMHPRQAARKILRDYRDYRRKYGSLMIGCRVDVGGELTADCYRATIIQLQAGRCSIKDQYQRIDRAQAIAYLDRGTIGIKCYIISPQIATQSGRLQLNKEL